MNAKDLIRDSHNQCEERYNNGARAEMSDLYAPDGMLLAPGMKAAVGKQGIPSYT